MHFSPFMRRARIVETTLISIVALLIVLRLALPFILKWYVNRTLAKIPGYYGHVEDIDVHLWRGAYEIQGLDLRKIEGKIPMPFFSVASADLSIQWRELFHGSLVGKIMLIDPQLNFVDADTKEQSQTSIDSSWQDRVQELFPLEINYFGIKNGSIHFRNLGTQPPVDIYLSKIALAANNLTNSRKSYSRLLATVRATGQPMDQGSFQLRVAFNPFEKNPTLDMDSTLSDLPLTTLSAFTRAYGGVVPEKGTMNLYMEYAARNGAFTGYVKPFITELRFSSFGDKNLTFKDKVKGLFANLLTWIFTNRKEDTLATKVEFSGDMKDVNVSTWAAIKQAFHHAFIEALPEKLDNSVILKNLPSRRAK